MQQQGPQRATELPVANTRAFTREEEEEAKEKEEEEGLLKGDLRWTSSEVRAKPWSHLLSLYKQLQKSVMTKFSVQEDLTKEEKGEEGSPLRLYDTHMATSQSSLRRTFMYTETLGFVESELKKLLSGPQDSSLWKVDSPKGQELPAQSKVIVKEEDDMLKSRSQKVEEEEGCSPIFEECWGPKGGLLRQLKLHPTLQGRVQSSLGEVSWSEPLLLEEMEN
ncbi:gametogenetin-binding protein 1-like isoform 2-T3 [Thomomys bottae]